MDNITDITTNILTDIRDEMRGMRSEMTGLRDEMRGMRTDVSARLDQTNHHTSQTNRRIDNLITIVGGSQTSQDERLSKLEGRVDKLERDKKRS